MSLPGGFHQSLTTWAEDVKTIEIQLPAQLFEELLMLLDSLVVELCGFIERSLEIFDLLITELCGLIERGLKVPNLLSESAQQLVTLLRISRP